MIRFEVKLILIEVNIKKAYKIFYFHGFILTSVLRSPFLYTFVVPILSLVICLLFVIIFAMYLLHVVYHYIFQCSLYILFFRIFPICPFPSRGF